MRHRRPLTKAELIARMPRGMRPTLDADQKRDLALAHIQNLDLIAKGQADEDVMWQWVGGVLTWSHVAQRLERGIPEMTEQLALATRTVTRYRRTGRVAFSGPDYQLAKLGVDVMDELARIVDRPTACEAADVSEAAVQALSAECSTRVAAEGDAHAVH